MKMSFGHFQKKCEVLLLSVFFSGIWFVTSAQIKFQRTYGIGVYNEGRSVKQTFDGGYIIAGTESDAGNGATDVYLLKVDSLGNFQWHKTYGGTGIDRGYSVEQLQDSGYAVAGYTNSFGYGGYDSYLIRTNKNGDTLWTKTYGTSNWDFTYAMKKTFDGGFVLAGNSYGGLSGNSEAWVFKLDSTGLALWSSKLIIPDESFLNAIIETPENDFVAVGYHTNGNNGSNDMLVTKLNAAGDSIWSRSYGDVYDDLATSIDSTIGGGYIVNGNLTNTSTGFKDCYLLKTDTAGIEEWHQEFVSQSGDFFSSIHQLSNGSFVTGGYSYGAGAGGSDFSLITTTNSGAFDSSGTYGTPQNEFAYDLIICRDSGYAMVGNTNGLGPEPTSLLLVKTDKWRSTSGTFEIGINKFERSIDKIEIHPNPASNWLLISFPDWPSHQFQNVEITISDVTGQAAFFQKYFLNDPINKNILLGIENLSNGFYVVSVVLDSYISKRKLIISR